MPLLTETPASSAPPSGAAGGDLTGAYPNPTIGAGKVVAADIAAGAAASNLGAAGGALAGTYPNPTLAWAYRNLLAGSAATIDTGANGIAQTGDLLEVIACLRTDEAVALSTLNILVNADASALYDSDFVGISNVTNATGLSQAQTQWTLQCPGANATAGVFNSVRFSFPFYSQTVGWKNGSMTYEVMLDTTAANTRLRQRGLQYRSTNAISRISFTPATGGASLVAGAGVLIAIR